MYIGERIVQHMLVPKAARQQQFLFSSSVQPKLEDQKEEGDGKTKESQSDKKRNITLMLHQSSSIIKPVYKYGGAEQWGKKYI